MNNGSGLHVVLGASGGIGIVRELVSRRHRVRAVSRSAPEGVEGVRADVSAPEDARAAVSGASVVYHAAQPDYSKWPEEFPPMTDAVIEGAAAAGAKLVFADNLHMYGPQPMNEETPPKATGKKGRTRALMAARLSQAHRSGRVLVTIGRASVYYGPGGTGSRGRPSSARSSPARRFAGRPHSTCRTSSTTCPTWPAPSPGSAGGERALPVGGTRPGRGCRVPVWTTWILGSPGSSWRAPSWAPV